MNYKQILEAIPHRYPFIFVDGILECDYQSSAKGYKNVTLSEPYVYGLKSDEPRFPPALITESMAQVGAVAILSIPENAGKIMLFAAVDNLRFYRPVYPGDQLVSEVRRVFTKTNLGKMKATAHVGDQLVAEGEFTYALVVKSDESLR